MGPVVVVGEPPVLEQDLGFEQGVERLQVGEFVAEVPVEGFGIRVLPGSSRLDIGDGRC
jgi:hypothetical protein